MNRFKLLFIAVLTLAFCSCKNANQNEVSIITPQEMQDLLELEDVQIVDVRSPEEYRKEYILHSQNIDFNSPTFDQDIANLDKTKPVILYCNTGKRSARCSEKLVEAGFVKIYDLKGGITQWKFKGHEVQTFE